MGEKSGQKVSLDNRELSYQETLHDDALMRAIAFREVFALEVIYGRYSRLLFPLCRRILRNETAAEEVLQDVFMEIWRIPGRFNPVRGSLIVYLSHLTRSRAIDRWRKDRKVRREYSTESDLGTLIASASHAKNEPPHMIELYEQIARMKFALGQLSALQRRPIELAFLDGLSHTQIAKVLSIPLRTIKARIRTGLIQLRKAFQNLTERETNEALAFYGDEVGSSATGMLDGIR